MRVIDRSRTPGTPTAALSVRGCDQNAHMAGFVASKKSSMWLTSGAACEGYLSLVLPASVLLQALRGCQTFRTWTGTVYCLSTLPALSFVPSIGPSPLS